MSYAADADTELMSLETAPATADSPAPDQVHEPRTARLRRLVADAVLLRAKIHQACRGHSFALNEVERIAHNMRGSAAMLGSHRVSAMSEAIEHLAAGVIADAEAHGPFAESALLQQISYCVEQLAEAVNVERTKASSSLSAYQLHGRLGRRDPAAAVAQRSEAEPPTPDHRDEGGGVSTGSLLVECPLSTSRMLCSNEDIENGFSSNMMRGSMIP